MCLSCGCGEPQESHDDPDNITLRTIERAASAAGIEPADVVRNIERGMGPQTAGGEIPEEQAPPASDDEPVVTEAHGAVM